MLKTVPKGAKELGPNGDPELAVLAEARHTCNISSKGYCMHEPVHHNQQPQAARNLQIQKSCKLPPRKGPRSHILPPASHFAARQAASPKILAFCTSSPAAKLTSSFHPHIHTRDPRKSFELGCAAERLFKKPGLMPFNAGRREACARTCESAAPLSSTVNRC